MVSRRPPMSVELLPINIADNTLVAPHDGRIQYRALPMWERSCPPAARSSPYWTSLTSTWTSSCPPCRPAASCSAPQLASCSTPFRTSPCPPGHLCRRSGPVHPENRRNPDRTRQAHVPGEGQDRSRAAARPSRPGEGRASRRRLRAARSKSGLAGEFQHRAGERPAAIRFWRTSTRSPIATA